MAVERKNVQVAEESLEMACARIEAGVINTVEVVQAQQTVSSAQLVRSTAFSLQSGQAEPGPRAGSC
jgi:outer membrane protein TolC